MSDSKIFKFKFTAYIKTVNLALKFPCVVSVIWKRGQKASQVKQRKEIQNGIVSFNQKLQIQCNMSLNTKTHRFEQKKTKFNVLIFSQKGNKQAGQVYLDVSELLNSKNKEIQYQKSLQKCPDKNAKLVFTLSGYAGQQIQQDQQSKKSTGTINMDALINNPSVKPDFKKKKKDQSNQKALPVDHSSKNANQIKTQENKNVIVSPKSNIQSQKVARQNISVNTQKLKLNKLEDDNKKLKEQLKQLKELQIQNQNLKMRFQQAQKISLSYYTKIFEQMRKQYIQYKAKSDEQKALLKKKSQMQKQMCECKQKMGRILNFALMSGNSSLAQQFYNIYQNKSLI